MHIYLIRNIALVFILNPLYSIQQSHANELNSVFASNFGFNEKSEWKAPIVPQLEQGHMEFHMYTLDHNGDLQKQWMSLQEIQDVIMADAVKRFLSGIEPYSKDHGIVSDEGQSEEGKKVYRHEYLGKIFPSQIESQESAQRNVSVNEILARVQKVMSREVTNALLKDPKGQENVDAVLSQQSSKVLSRMPAIINTFSLTELDTTTIGHDTEQTTFDEVVGTTSPSRTSDEYSDVTTSLETITDIPFDDVFMNYEDIETFSTSTHDSITESSTVGDITTSLQELSEHNVDEVTKKENYSSGEHFADVHGRYSKPMVLGKGEYHYYSREPEIIYPESSLAKTKVQKLTSLKTYIKDLQKVGSINQPKESSFHSYGSQSARGEQEPASYHDFPVRSGPNLAKHPFSSMDKAAEVSTGNVGKKTVYYDYPNKDGFSMKSDVLSHSEIGDLPLGNLEYLENSDGRFENNFFEFNNEPIYLEDIGESDSNVDYHQLVSQVKKKNDSRIQSLDFPRPETANSFERPSHLPRPSQPSSVVHVDPTQFLPSHNPEVARRKSPLKKTPPNNVGLEWSVVGMQPDERAFINQMNDVIFKVYSETIQIHRRQNLVLSSLNLVSTLSMLLLGARGRTAGALSNFLKMERFNMFNPHLLLKNITESLMAINDVGHESAVFNSFFVEKLTPKDYNLDFYGRSIEHFYRAIVRQDKKSKIGTLARDLANRFIRRRTGGAVRGFLRPNSSLNVNGPLSAVSSAYFQMNWDLDLKAGNLVDMSFIRFPSAERRLIRTVGLSRKMTINAGYSELHDVTIAEVPLKSSMRELSLVLVLPGQQKDFIANGLVTFEKSLTARRWNEVLRAVIPHYLNVKIPIFSHRNYLNLSGILDNVGLGQLFTDSADFSGINGVKDLQLGDAIQLSEFHSCKLDLESLGKSSNVGEHLNISASSTLESNLNNSEGMDFTDKKTSRMGTLPDEVEGTLAFDRAFLYVLRHNPTGLILYIGRYLDPETF